MSGSFLRTGSRASLKCEQRGFGTPQTGRDAAVANGSRPWVEAHRATRILVIMRRLLPLLVPLFVLLGCSPAQLATSKNQVPYSIEGDTLVHHDAEFSVSIPAAGWHWEVLESDDPNFPTKGGFSCDNASGEEWIIVSVNDSVVEELSDEVISAYLGRPFDSAPGSPRDLNAERVRLDGLEAVRYRETERTEDGGVRQVSGYLVNAKYLVTLTMTSELPGEPEPLAQLAQTVRRLR